MRVRLDTAANQYANAVGKLGKVKLDEAVEFYLRHHDQQTEEIDVAQLVERFLAFKEACGASVVYQRDLEYRTRSFVKFHFESVTSLSAEVMSAYFSELRFEPQNHNNQLRVIRTLLNFAKSQGYLPGHHRPAQGR